MEPGVEDLWGPKSKPFTNFEAVIWAYFIKIRLIKMKRLAEVMVDPTHLSLFLTNNHNCPSMLQCYLSFSPLPPSPTFLKPFNFEKRNFSTVLAKFSPSWVLLSLLFSQDPSSLSLYCEWLVIVDLGRSQKILVPQILKFSIRMCLIFIFILIFKYELIWKRNRVDYLCSKHDHMRLRL